MNSESITYPLRRISEPTTQTPGTNFTADNNTHPGTDFRADNTPLGTGFRANNTPPEADSTADNAPPGTNMRADNTHLRDESPRHSPKLGGAHPTERAALETSRRAFPYTRPAANTLSPPPPPPGAPFSRKSFALHSPRCRDKYCCSSEHRPRGVCYLACCPEYYTVSSVLGQVERSCVQGTEHWAYWMNSVVYVYSVNCCF